MTRSGYGAPVLRALMLATSLATAQGAGAITPAASADALFASSCKGADGYGGVFGGRRTFLWRAAQLERLKAERESDADVAKALKALLVRAGEALGHKPYSVVDKTWVPPSRDKHDYLSIGPYWWPDPLNPHGPYVRRDGEVNPERATEAFDAMRMQAMSDDVESLALAYFYTDDRRYADGAARLVRAWFLDPATRMNPNMDYAQSVPGREAGRAEGVLDTSRLQPVVEAIGLIAPSGAISAQEQQGLERWFSRYVDWMLRSANGRAERAASNNHGMWFDAQIAQFALFARRPDVAREVVDAFPKRRIAAQFEPDGKLPRELERTRSYHYSLYALTAAYGVADIGECLGVNLWAYRDGKGRGLRSATDFVARYAKTPGAWPYREMKPSPGETADLLTRAAWAWSSPAYSLFPPGPGTVLRYDRFAKP